MEDPGMDEVKAESHMTSAAAFVEGGIQEALDDSCSICLEAFCDSDPGTVTSCKHEFHLQCILEWCQRSSNCPMCWQSLSLKDPSSQELLEAVEQERRLRFNPTRNSTIFHHPALGNFELQHLPVGVNDAELEERIIQHLAAAAAMGRTHHVGRREGSRSRSSSHGRPQFLVFSTHPNGPPMGSFVGEPEPAAINVARPSTPLISGAVESAQYMSTQGSSAMPIDRQGTSVDGSSSNQTSMPDRDRAGSSDFQSLADSWKSRLNSISMRYKESISKSTRGWKERLFSRSTSMSDTGSEARCEMNAGVASIARIIDRLEIGERFRQGRLSTSSNSADSSAAEESNHNDVDTHHETTPSVTGTAVSGSTSTSN